MTKLQILLTAAIFFISSLSFAQGVYRTGGPSYGTPTCRGALSPKLEAPKEPELALRPTESAEGLQKFEEILGTLVTNSRLRKEAKTKPEVLQAFYASQMISSGAVIGLMVEALDFNYKALTLEAIEEGYQAFESFDYIRTQSRGRFKIPDLNEIEILARAVTTFNYRSPIDKDLNMKRVEEAISLVLSIPRANRLHPGFSWHLAEFYYYKKDYTAAQNYLLDAFRASLMPKYSPDKIPSQTLITALEEVSKKSGVELNDDIKALILKHKLTETYVFFDDTMWGPYLIGLKGKAF